MIRVTSLRIKLFEEGKSGGGGRSRSRSGLVSSFIDHHDIYDYLDPILITFGHSLRPGLAPGAPGGEGMTPGPAPGTVSF